MPVVNHALPWVWAPGGACPLVAPSPPALPLGPSHTLTEAPSAGTWLRGPQERPGPAVPWGKRQAGTNGAPASSPRVQPPPAPGACRGRDMRQGQESPQVSPAGSAGPGCGMVLGPVPRCLGSPVSWPPSTSACASRGAGSALHWGFGPLLAAPPRVTRRKAAALPSPRGSRWELPGFCSDSLGRTKPSL